MSFNDTASEAVIKGTNAAIKTPDNGWQSAAEALQDNGGGFNPAMFIARTAQNYKTPRRRGCEPGRTGEGIEGRHERDFR
jgi:hypothetical protein